MITDIDCVILTGGKSSRMKADAGIDKAHLDFWGEPLYFRQFQKLSKIFHNTYISAKTFDDYPKLSTLDIVKDLQSVENMNTSALYAPALGMLSAFEVLQSKKIFFIAVDTPFVSEDSINALTVIAQNIKKNAVVASVEDKIHPTCGIYSKEVTGELKQMILEDKHKLTLFLEKIGTMFVETGDADEFANLNRYEDYERVIKDGVNPFR
jgi:molybdenum cofactor guanylyltransferase